MSHKLEDVVRLQATNVQITQLHSDCYLHWYKVPSSAKFVIHNN